MVKGFESFKNWFSGFEDCYTIIGGTACDIVMAEVGRDFRATKDLDVVLIAEALTPEFCARLWAYIDMGGYKHLNKGTGKMEFYRFTHPAKPDYPAMIELFSRKPDAISLPKEAVLTPLPVDEGIASLSAILLDEEYYEFLREGRQTIDGVSILPPSRLIPFKMKAWLDLSSRKSSGEQVDGKDIRKHRNDVFRLVELLNPSEIVETTPVITNDIALFIDEAEKDDVNLKQLGIRMDKTSLFERLRFTYGLIDRT